ncbi:MAG: HNH endonuclease [Chthoniobacteraceae bacterium]
MDAATRDLVRTRAGDRCEYCRLAQRHMPLPALHIEHIVARKHRGGDEPENLAFPCDQCNLHKGADLSGLDPDTGELVRLFHPRRDARSDHFRFDGARIAGLTPCGRTTAWLLQMNSEERVELRSILAALGELA